MKYLSLPRQLAGSNAFSAHAEIKDSKRLLEFAELEEALWTATGVDADSLAMDRSFLGYMDFDGNGRILCKEAKRAIQLLADTLVNPESAFSGTAAIALDEIRTDTDAGRELHAACTRVITDIDLPLSEGDHAAGKVISLQTVDICRRTLATRPVSEDGVVLPESVEDPELSALLMDMIRAVGGAPHPSGRTGINLAELAEFFAEAKARIDWLSETRNRREILPFGGDTHAHVEKWDRWKNAIDSFFSLDAAASIDPQAVDYARNAISGRLRAISAGMEPGTAPVAIPCGDTVLRLSTVVEPGLKADLGDIMAMARRMLVDGASSSMKPISADTMSLDEFRSVDALLKPYRAWRAREKGAGLSFIEEERLSFLVNSGIAERAEALIARRSGMALTLKNLADIERFLLFKRDLVKFLNNFAVFPYLYDPDVSAAFEAGSFIADGRKFAFSVHVRDMARHRQSATYSRLYVLYLEVRPGEPEAYNVAVPVTSGSEGRLYKGKHGLFREPDGTERDAIIVDILENPISIPETLAMPFKKAYKAISSKVDEMGKKAEEKLAKSAAERADSAFTGSQKQAANVIPPPPAVSGKQAPSRPGQGGGAMGNMLAGGSIAIAALGSSFAFISKTFSEMRLEAVLATVGGIAAAVIVPVLISALFKLKSRDLSPLLEASGIAMNRSIKLSRAQARFFTVAPRFNRRMEPTARKSRESVTLP